MFGLYELNVTRGRPVAPFCGFGSHWCPAIGELLFCPGLLRNPPQCDNVTFDSPDSRGLRFIFLNVANFKGTQISKALTPDRIFGTDNPKKQTHLPSSYFCILAQSCERDFLLV